MASSVPDKMRAWESPEPEKGVAGMAQTDSRPVAHPVQPEGSDPPSVTIKINAAALNPVDYHVIGAMGSMVKSWPFTTGCDMAGTVAEVASGSKWNVRAAPACPTPPPPPHGCCALCIARRACVPQSCACGVDTPRQK